MTALAAEVIKASSRPSRFRFSYGNPGEEKPDVFKRVAHICEERYGVAAEWPPEVRQKLQSLLTHLGDIMRMPALPAPEKSRASQMRIAADSKAFGGYRLLGV